MHEDDRRPATFPILRRVDAAEDSCAVARLETSNRRIDPFVSKELRDRRSCYWFCFAHFFQCERLVRKQIEFRRFVAERSHIREHRFIRRDIDLIVAGEASDARALTAARGHRIKMSFKRAAFAGSEIEFCFVR